MQTVVSVLILYICLNTGIGVMTEAFGVNIGIPIVNALYEFNTHQQTISNTVNSNGGFQPTLIFGDWLAVGRMFINFFTGGYIIEMFTLFAMAGINFPPIFIIGVGALFAIALVWGLMYLISGRGTKMSD